MGRTMARDKVVAELKRFRDILWDEGRNDGYTTSNAERKYLDCVWGLIEDLFCDNGFDAEDLRDARARMDRSLKRRAERKGS